MPGVDLGHDQTIAEIAEMASRATGYTDRTDRDTSKPDGTPRTLPDVGTPRTRGWQSTTSLRDGIRDTVSW